ncbi:MAG: hypothetical protein JSS07_00530 [Proteobacteria bacterium]|nr:hypothetical protein [Pseudomonadota bacterium]
MLNLLYKGPDEEQKKTINKFMTTYIHPNANVYIGPDQTKRAKIKEFIVWALNDKTLQEMDTLPKQIAYLRGAMDPSLELTDIQLAVMLKIRDRVINDIEGILVTLHHKKLHPTAKLGLQISLCLSAIYCTPELFALYTAKEAMTALLKPQLGLYSELADRIASFGLLFTGQSITSQIRYMLPASITNLGFFVTFPALIFASMPCNFLLKNATEPVKELGALATHPQTIEAASDFFDILHGQESDVTAQKYQGSLACKSTQEISSDVGNGLRFIWNSLTRRSSNNTVPVNENVKLKLN